MSARKAMRAAALAAVMVVLGGCSGGQEEGAMASGATEVASWQPDPAAVAAEAATLDGQALFVERCGMCHQSIGMAVSILSRRPGDASGGLLEQRDELSAAFVQVAVRNGILNMPRMPRAEVSDPELAAIANHLSKGKP
jgi:mono/diheme cytochrome c family protein